MLHSMHSLPAALARGQPLHARIPASALAAAATQRRCCRRRRPPQHPRRPVVRQAAPADGDAGGDAGATPAQPQDKQQQKQEARRAGAVAQQRQLLVRDLGRVWRLALPLMGQNVASYLLSIVGAVFIGRLGALPLSASVLGNSLYAVSGLALAYGLSAGSETLCGAAYGAGDYKRLGLILQRALLVCWSVCAAVAVLWSQSHALLLAMGQQPEIAALASRYLIFCTPCLFLSSGIECVRKYLQAQRVVQPGMVVAGATLLASPLVFWLFVNRLGLGLDGAALAFCACNGATLLGLFGVVAWRASAMQGSKEQTWAGFSWEAWKEWPSYCRYGLPAAAYIMSEWLAYEGLILMSGLLPDAEVALSTMGILLNVNAWLYMLPMGLGAAVNTSVANAFGAGHAAAAARAYLGGVTSVFALQAALFLMLLSPAGPALAGLFTADATVLAAAAEALPLLALLVVFDGVNAVLGGVLRGAGRQMTGAAVNFGGYWCLGLPLAALLALGPPAMGTTGLWLGIIAGAATQAVVLLVMLSRWDWRRETARVQAAVVRGEADDGGDGTPQPSFGH